MGHTRNDNLITVYNIVEFVWRVTFRRIRKISKSAYELRHVIPSVHLHATTLLPLNELSGNFIFVENLSRKFKIHSNQIRTAVTLRHTNIYLWSSLRMRDVLDNEFERKWKHILCSLNFIIESRPVYKIMCKNIADLDRSQITICGIPKAKNTHSDYVILIAFPLQRWLHDRASMLRYMCIAYLVR
jgi:hypothetical protein